MALPEKGKTRKDSKEIGKTTKGRSGKAHPQQPAPTKARQVRGAPIDRPGSRQK